ncbi:MAG: Gfo/Idh/MocA family oxidoreductase [Gemmataceae bacterium]|nr:Gfo/Idh/MocA family oxidoreductase [Gemmataceae bacterium]MDW8267436.1 Gfo/Idh/MocA family oxidoreductase [Gemmataceae bacterium]
MTARAISRRSFLATSAAVLAAPNVLRAKDSPNRLNIAIIGAGGRGAANTKGVASENIVALCDVNRNDLEAAGAKYPSAKRYTDFRKLFDDARLFDAVVISTTEHTHALATLLALRHGKHVYCEKPLTHNVWEARKVREEAARAKVATQMGIQLHASDNYRRIVELVRAGVVGPIREAHVWVSRAWGWQSPEAAKRNKDIVATTERPSEAMPVPPHLDWDLWLGPAPERPFHAVYVPGPKWYRWWDFGSGTMSDLGSHWNDLPFWALNLQAPQTVTASGPPVHPELAPASMHVTYTYGPRGDQPPVTLHWYQGEEKPEIWKTGGIPQWNNGILLVGAKGMILADYAKHVLLPEKEFADLKRPEPSLPRTPSIYAEWIEACKGGPPCLANFEYSGWLTEANHLGNVAYRVGKTIEWDAVKLRATNAPEADAYIRRAYRKGWEL